ncbi:MAG: hypothetical protein WCH34_07465 [Bacteroidota bacterium]
MKLSEILEKEKQFKAFEVFSQIKERIEKVSKSEIIKAIDYNKREFFLEKQILFSQKTEITDKYFLIDLFDTLFYSLEGAPFSYEEKFEIAKKNLLNRYREHSFLPEIMVFIEQGDEAIVEKLGHYHAYLEIEDLFNSHISVIRNKLKKNIIGGVNSLNYPKSSISEFKKLFRTTHASDVAENIIKEKLILDGEWVGKAGKQAEITALIVYLDDHDYIKYTSLTKAVKLFCSMHNFVISDRTARQKEGFAYNDAYKYYQSLFPQIKVG